MGGTLLYRDCIYCDREYLISPGWIKKITYIGKNRMYSLTDIDSIERISKVLNQSYRVNRHGKSMVNAFSTDVYVLELENDIHEVIRLDVRRISETTFDIYLREGNSSFKQCTYSNDKLAIINWGINPFTESHPILTK